VLSLNPTSWKIKALRVVARLFWLASAAFVLAGTYLLFSGGGGHGFSGGGMFFVCMFPAGFCFIAGMAFRDFSRAERGSQEASRAQPE
jgi:hypothetical protein